MLALRERRLDEDDLISDFQKTIEVLTTHRGEGGTRVVHMGRGAHGGGPHGLNMGVRGAQVVHEVPSLNSSLTPRKTLGAVTMRNGA